MRHVYGDEEPVVHEAGERCQVSMYFVLFCISSTRLGWRCWRIGFGYRVIVGWRVDGATGDVGSCIFCFYFGIALPEGVAWDLLMCLLFRDEAC